MTSHQSHQSAARSAVRINRFDMTPHVIREEPSSQTSVRHAVVKVTHASVGVTDAMAARGDYLLHPFPGFTPGYDLVGRVQQLPEGDNSGLAVGQRVVALLPGMGAHATTVRVSPSLLVALPESVDELAAATVPLDALTAHFALQISASDGGSVLIQGAGGAVGAWATQMAVNHGITVVGTGSSRSAAYAESLGAREIYDYRDHHWMDQLQRQFPGGVDGVIDHTGSRDVREAAKPTGIIVRTAFGGPVGHQRAATARGMVTTSLLRWAHPRERICSVPVLVALRRGRYRRALSQILKEVADGLLKPPEPEVFTLDGYAQALAAASHGRPGIKLVLRLD